MGMPLSTLVVEDSEDDFELMLLELRRAGYDANARRVDNAADLSAALGERRWDVVLSDFRLPGFGASEALDLLRASGQDIPFIVVSAVIEETEAIALMRRGARDYLMKSALSRLAPAVARELAEAADRQARKTAETALRENEERLQSIIKSTSDAIVVVGEDGNILLYSPGAAAMFGHTAEEAIGRPVTLLIPPEYHAAHAAGFSRFRAARQPTVMGKVVELSGRRKDGETFPLELSLSHASVNGRLEFFAIIRDIGVRKRMETELVRQSKENERARNALLSVLEDQRETTAQLRRQNIAYATLSQTNEAIVRLDSRDALFERICRIAVDTGGFLGAWIGLLDEASNTLKPVARAGRLDEYIGNLAVSGDAAQPAGRGPSAIAFHEDRPYYCNDFLSDPATAPWHEQARRFGIGASAALPLRRRNFVVGTLNLYSADKAAFDEGTCALLEEMAKDVSFALGNFDREALRRQAEADLRENEALFRSLVEQNVAAIFMIDGERIVFANPRACEILGYEKGELDGKNTLGLVAEDFRADVAEMMRSILARETESVERNLIGRRKDGSPVDIGARATLALLDGRPMVLGIAQDIGERKRAQEEIQRYVARLEQSMMATVEAVSAMVELRDPYTSGHEHRVGELAAAIGGALGLPAETVTGLRMTGYVHDVGKISVPAEILTKPGRLTELEFEIVKGHARSGYDILKKVEFPWPLPEVILQHHERLDGSGYPQGLKGDAIIQEARIMAVADVVEAMASHRPYRPGLGLDRALEEIERNSGKFYDPAVAAACLRLFREEGYELPT